MILAQVMFLNFVFSSVNDCDFRVRFFENSKMLAMCNMFMCFITMQICNLRNVGWNIAV